MSIAVKNLTKIYGQQKALDNISFSIKPGEIVGFLGPNGAGKSTTMKIASCYLPPTSGSLKVCDMEVTQEPLNIRRRLGYLPEHNPLYLDMYVHEYLRFIGQIHQLTGKELREAVGRMVEMFGLTKEQNKQLGALSKGYRQRVGLAQALIHDPPVLILDEPTTGLDPNQITEIRELIKEISREKTVLFSTHIMQEVQALCKRVIIIDNGTIVADKQVNRLKAGSGEQAYYNSIRVSFKNKVTQQQLEAIEGVMTVSEADNGAFMLTADMDKDMPAKIYHYAVAQDWTLIHLSQESHSLEQIFRELTDKGGGK